MSGRKMHMSGGECRGGVFGVRVSNTCHLYVRECFKGISAIIDLSVKVVISPQRMPPETWEFP